MQFSKLLASFLKEQFQIHFATGVKNALQVMKDVTVDAICCDFNMFDGTGIDLLKKIREDGCYLPFLLISGSDDIQMINEVKINGASFCCKTDRNLISEIRKLSDANNTFINTIKKIDGK